MACSTVDDFTLSHIFAIMDHDCPEVDEDEKENIGELLERENEGEDMVWQALSPAVDRVEGMGSKRTRHDPFVMWLVQGFVNLWMMKTSVNPVDEEIGE